MTIPFDDAAGSFADGLVWCSCGWFAALADPDGPDLVRRSAEAWEYHAEDAHPLEIG